MMFDAGSLEHLQKLVGSYDENIDAVSRGLGVTVSGFDCGVEQMSIDDLAGDYDKKARAEAAVEAIRKKHGYSKLQRGIMYEDRLALGMDVRGERLVRPAGLDGEIASQDEGEFDIGDDFTEGP